VDVVAPRVSAQVFQAWYRRRVVSKAMIQFIHDRWRESGVEQHLGQWDDKAVKAAIQNALTFLWQRTEARVSGILSNSLWHRLKAFDQLASGSLPAPPSSTHASHTSPHASLSPVDAARRFFRRQLSDTFLNKTSPHHLSPHTLSPSALDMSSAASKLSSSEALDPHRAPWDHPFPPLAGVDVVRRGLNAWRALPYAERHQLLAAAAQTAWDHDNDASSAASSPHSRLLSPNSMDLLSKTPDPFNKSSEEHTPFPLPTPTAKTKSLLPPSDDHPAHFPLPTPTAKSPILDLRSPGSDSVTSPTRFPLPKTSVSPPQLAPLPHSSLPAVAPMLDTPKHNRHEPTTPLWEVKARGSQTSGSDMEVIDVAKLFDGSDDATPRTTTQSLVSSVGGSRTRSKPLGSSDGDHLAAPLFPGPAPQTLSTLPMLPPSAMEDPTPRKRESTLARRRKNSLSRSKKGRGSGSGSDLEVIDVAKLFEGSDEATPMRRRTPMSRELSLTSLSVATVNTCDTSSDSVVSEPSPKPLPETHSLDNPIINSLNAFAPGLARHSWHEGASPEKTPFGLAVIASDNESTNSLHSPGQQGWLPPGLSPFRQRHSVLSERLTAGSFQKQKDVKRSDRVLAKLRELEREHPGVLCEVLQAEDHDGSGKLALAALQRAFGNLQWDLAEPIQVQEVASLMRCRVGAGDDLLDLRPLLEDVGAEVPAKK